jgi:hypothetical protein
MLDGETVGIVESTGRVGEATAICGQLRGQPELYGIGLFEPTGRVGECAAICGERAVEGAAVWCWSV